MNKKIVVFGAVLVLCLAFLLNGFVTRVAEANIFDSLGSFLKGLPGIQNGGGDSVLSEGEVKNEAAPLYKPVIDYENAVIGAVESAAPSVVSIVVSKDLPNIENCPYDPFGNLPPEFRDFFGGGFGSFSQPCQRGTIRQEVGGGTGFIVSEDGLIVTNKHVVSDEKAEYTVFTSDGEKYDAKVTAIDPVQDIAIIKISAANLKPADLGDSDSLKLGQTVIAIGNSLGEFRNTVSVGVVSGLSRTITAGTRTTSETIQGVVQTDAAINPGNSGGPLLNLKGEVIGINTAIVSGAQNIGFAIPINQAKRDIESVKKTGEIKVPYLGVRYMIINEDIKERQGLSVDYGALVRGTEEGPGVVPGSPADKSGIKAEDVILEINGEKISTEKPLAQIIQRHEVGDTVTLTVQRGGESLTLKIVLGERPE